MEELRRLYDSDTPVVAYAFKRRMVEGWTPEHSHHRGQLVALTAPMVRRSGWLAGVRDPEVGKAMALLHRKPAHPWTIAALANDVGTSRSVLAERFRRYLSETPIAYLTRWRLQLGAQMLKSTSSSVAQIAAEVGYESEPAFNRAFKRKFGLPPARFRNQAKLAHSKPVRHASTKSRRSAKR
jgi:transcriptional regulator GlxA family with amidase domain